MLTYIPELPDTITALDFRYNHLPSISAETFHNISKLAIEKLKLHNNRITNITKDTFEKLRQIQEIDLRGNKKINKTQLAESFDRIQKSKELELRLDECALVEIPGGFFNGLQDAMLVNISLQWNGMKTFNDTPFQNLKHLKTIDLTNNWIENITHSYKGAGFESIETLTLTGNNFYKFAPSFCFNSKPFYPNLKSLILENNFISNPLGNAWLCLKKLEILSLRSNVIIVLQDNMFSDLESLEVLDVSNMVRSIKIIPVNVFDIPQLKVLHFENNHMIFREHSKIPFVKLFSNLRNLQTIYLGSNDFGQLSHTGMIRMLEPLKNLENLHLSDANLEDIPRGLLEKFHNLTTLTLGNNRISKIEPRREKTGLRGFRPGPTQTGLYKLRKELEA